MANKKVIDYKEHFKEICFMLENGIDFSKKIIINNFYIDRNLCNLFKDKKLPLSSKENIIVCLFKAVDSMELNNIDNVYLREILESLNNKKEVKLMSEFLFLIQTFLKSNENKDISSILDEYSKKYIYTLFKSDNYYLFLSMIACTSSYKTTVFNLDAKTLIKKFITENKQVINEFNKNNYRYSFDSVFNSHRRAHDCIYVMKYPRKKYCYFFSSSNKLALNISNDVINIGRMLHEYYSGFEYLIYYKYYESNFIGINRELYNLFIINSKEEYLEILKKVNELFDVDLTQLITITSIEKELR